MKKILARLGGIALVAAFAVSGLVSSAGAKTIDTLLSMQPAKYTVPATPAVKIAVSVPGAYQARRVDSPLAPGKDLYPKVYEHNRFVAMMDLLRKIYLNAPLPYPSDGIVFMNKEGILPQQPEGFYHEYTLIVPGRPMQPHMTRIGDRDYMVGKMIGQRGPERIIIGGGAIIYYTPDHYRTFIEMKIIR